MIVIENRFLPPKGFLAINIFGILFVRWGNQNCLKIEHINHEQIHTAQMKEMLYIFFYLWYVVEWLIRCIQYKSNREAYYNISFEREAYANQNDLAYLSQRRFWSWYLYLTIKK